ncbi:hypothetical protein HDV00_011836 [Rhizophlyctis rosea]|nr:hypothetical protein HDV00_011836 [Rhizophlyctis rosea]
MPSRIIADTINSSNGSEDQWDTEHVHGIYDPSDARRRSIASPTAFNPYNQHSALRGTDSENLSSFTEDSDTFLQYNQTEGDASRVLHLDSNTIDNHTTFFIDTAASANDSAPTTARVRRPPRVVNFFVRAESPDFEGADDRLGVDIDGDNDPRGVGDASSNSFATDTHMDEAAEPGTALWRTARRGGDVIDSETTSSDTDATASTSPTGANTSIDTNYTLDTAIQHTPLRAAPTEDSNLAPSLARRRYSIMDPNAASAQPTQPSSTVGPVAVAAEWSGGHATASDVASAAIQRLESIDIEKTIRESARKMMGKGSVEKLKGVEGVKAKGRGRSGNRVRSQVASRENSVPRAIAA